MLRPYRLGLCLLACLLFVPQAGATDRASQRGQFRAALAAAARPPEGAWKKLAAGLDAQRYPLYPYIELAALRPHLAKLDQADVERFLERWPDTLPAQELREAWLRELARRGDWKAFRADWAPSEDRELQCDALLARLAGGSRLDYAKDIEGIWSGERSLPDSCNAVLRAARVDGIVTDPIVWEHLIRAADSGSASAAGDAAALLSGSERIAADRIVAALRDPRATLAKAKAWADEPRARDAMSYGFARLARRDSDAAETQWAELEARFKWDATQKNRVLNAIALYRATSYSPDAVARLKALPAAADDEATREWRVRVALADSDWAATLAALERLSDVQKADARWRYLRARVLAKLGRDAESASLMAEVAREANFHGFLAADWSGRPYSICPNTLAGDAEAVAALAQQPDLERAYEFRELGMLPEARREWKFAMGKLDEGQRRLAADGAYRKGWYDRAVFAFSGDPDTQRLYEQRFPLGMQSAVKREAAGAGIDPAWAYAIIRAESAWMSDAHSHADAYGLMQLLPGVAKKLAKAEKLPYERARDLFDPALNVQLGTRFLGRMAAAYDGSPWLASAAYNAGQAPVGRWLEARGTLEPDFFIETIPYKETREYVARVLAFSVIYDWRMNGKVLALSARMPKIGQPYRAPTDATPRKTIVCATTAVEREPPVDAPASEAPTPEAGGDEPAAAPPLPSSPAH
jgi:soluble lytic murein transglycosylase